MWPFRRRTKEAEKSGKGVVVKRVIAGLVIGGAIASVIGKRVLEKHEEDIEGEDEERE